MISTKRGDNCVKIGPSIGVVRNILQCNGEVFLVYKIFTQDESLFDYPLDSKVIDMHLVSNIGNQLQVVNITSVQGKYTLLPHHRKYAAIPLIHSS